MHRHSQIARLISFAVLVSALGGPDCSDARADSHLWPDLVPFVADDKPYLADWRYHQEGESTQIRIGTVFANAGLGLFQIRTDEAGSPGARTPIVQRVFLGQDNGAEFEDFELGTTVNFHHVHAHVHLEDFSQFSLHEVTQPEVSFPAVGRMVSDNVKTSFNLVHSVRLPGPQWADAIPFPSSNRGQFQNIAAGFGDFYSHDTEGQSITVDDLPIGFYWLRQTVDPLNLLHETDKTNNSVELLIHLDRPGDAMRHPDGSFVRPGEFFPLLPGDLNRDELVDIRDWIQFRDTAGMDLAGLSADARYLLGDMNLDSQHTPGDFLLFKNAFDAENGAGAFARMLAVPEPGGLLLVLVLLGVGALRRVGRRGRL